MSKTQDYGDVSVPNTRRAPNNMQKLKIKKLINMGKKCFQLAFGSVNGINSMKWWRQIIPRAGGGGAVTVNKRVMTWYVALRSMWISWKCLPKKMQNSRKLQARKEDRSKEEDTKPSTTRQSQTMKMHDKLFVSYDAWPGNEMSPIEWVSKFNYNHTTQYRSFWRQIHPVT